MHFSLYPLFDLGGLSKDLRRSLGLIYASSVMVIMGINLIQPVLPAMIAPLRITDADIGLVIAVYSAPAIILAPLLGFAADRYGRRPLLATGRQMGRRQTRIISLGAPGNGPSIW